MRKCAVAFTAQRSPICAPAARPEENLDERHDRNSRHRKSRKPAAKVARRPLLARLLSLGRAGANREARSVCVLVGVMVLIDKVLPIDGLITEIGRGSLIFRPASTYILDRTGAAVSLRFGDQEVRGVITDVTASGYDVKLLAPLTDAAVRSVVEQFGMTGPAVAAAA